MDDVDCDELFDALRNVHRRRIVLALLQLDGQRERVQVPEDVHAGDKELEHLQIELIHQHLPRLADAEYVTWNWETHEVERGPAFEEIESILKLLHEHRDELPEDFV